MGEFDKALDYKQGASFVLNSKGVCDLSSRRTVRLVLLLWLLLAVAGGKAEWSQIDLDIDGEAEGDRSGDSVALSSDGNHVAIGAPFNDGNGADSGQVRVYGWNGTAWIQVGSDIDGEAAGDQFGDSVALSSNGNRVAIGASDSDGNGEDSGHVRVFDWSGDAWVQAGQDIDGEDVVDRSGGCVAMSSDGERIAIGAMWNDGSGTSSGHVRVYEWTGTNWLQLGLDIDGENPGDWSGSSVALSSDGSRVAIGAPYNEGNGASSGHGRVYAWNGTAWTQLGLDLDGEAAEDHCGSAVALSSDGSRLAIGAVWNDGNGENSGHVRIFDWSGSAWIQAGFDIDGESANDQCGSALAFSSDGNRVAIGADRADGGGPFSGHVRVYGWTGTDWQQIGADLDGEDMVNHFGCSVALSSYGNRVAIGAIWNDGNGSNSGHVRVYEDTHPVIPTTGRIGLTVLMMVLGIIVSFDVGRRHHSAYYAKIPSTPEPALPTPL